MQHCWKYHAVAHLMVHLTLLIGLVGDFTAHPFLVDLEIFRSFLIGGLDYFTAHL